MPRGTNEPALYQRGEGPDKEPKLFPGGRAERVRRALSSWRASGFYNVPMSLRRTSLPGITRRQWSAGLMVAPLAAQVKSDHPFLDVPLPVQPPETPGQRLIKSYEDVRQSSERLSQIEVPMNLEPAFSFRA